MPNTATEGQSQLRRRPNPGTRAYTIYVIRLKSTVLKDRRFRQKNPDYVDKKPCVYVGMTYLTCEERLAQHQSGIHSARIVRNFGKHCVSGLCRRTKAITRSRALKREAKLAATLREKGWGVWSN